MVKMGRRPGESGTREAILDAARETFAAVGYERATIRAIARGAGVDPALVHHYFGTKEDLFVAATDLPVNPAEAIRSILAEGLDGAGERIVRFFLATWDSPQGQDTFMSVLRSALTNDQAGRVIREFAGRAIVGTVAAALPGRDAELRALAIASHMLGIAFLRYGVRLDPLASARIDDIVALVAPRIQSYLTGERPRG
jgi:AcrR family transcriptional regulator